MSNAKRPTKEITLLGRGYIIACDTGEEAKLDRAARYLDRAMQGIMPKAACWGVSVWRSWQPSISPTSFLKPWMNTAPVKRTCTA